MLHAMQRHEAFPVDIIHMVGSRQSGKTMAVEEFVCNACDMVDPNGNEIMVSVYVLRHERKNIIDLWTQYAQGLNEISVQPIQLKTEYRWDFPNGSMVRFMSMSNKNKNSVVGAGMASACGEYIIVVYEEAFEYSDVERNLFRQAVRGNRPDAKMLEINVCNPWYPKNSYLASCIKEVPFNRERMAHVGWQITKKIKQTPSGKDEVNLYCYTNWRAIREVLPQWSIDNILKSYEVDPMYAECADLGIPSYQAGSIYAPLMKWITPAKYTAHEFICGGGDIGVGHSEKSGITSFLFMGIDIKGYIDIYGEYDWDNKKQMKDSYQMSADIVCFYQEQRNKYFENTGIMPKSVSVSVDNSEQAFISILNKTASDYGFDSWLAFHPCRKYKVNDRIAITQGLMRQGRIRIAPSVDNLQRELQLSVWDEKASRINKRIDDNDHSINAFEYGFEDFMYDMT